MAFPVPKSHHYIHVGIKAAQTDLCCFTDDDAIWNANFLKWLLVPFDDPQMGGTGSSQIMRPNDLTKPPTVYERIADMRLSGRMLEACASTFYDGSVSCLSGRTALYHKRILTDSFPSAFCNELWMNKCVLFVRINYSQLGWASIAIAIWWSRQLHVPSLRAQRYFECHSRHCAVQKCQLLEYCIAWPYFAGTHSFPEMTST